MWDFFATVRHRHSVRRYQQGRAVEAQKLHGILEMACAAPSAGDLQAYHIIAVSDDSTRKALSDAAQGQSFVADAPVCLVFCAEPETSARDYGDRGRELYALQDATIAASYAQLAAVAEGLASTWVGFFDRDAVSAVLQLPGDRIPIALLCVGYPAELPEPTPRRAMSEVVSHVD